ncbi:copper chaperone CopZ [Chitinivorax tropicus]|uniref:Copper chaperone CopZ n=1 Tax=Chitinivorax tropicus TaxID=714531 RepID=A0A840MLI1_9PROT|nr:heavy-metal-associated domain-containing protein [Chitinivorax tropicus]MBB5019498.1 copper chaperone CopZ [Chitinivorax tropicus]
MEYVQLNVSGMSCGGCANSITKALQALAGVAQVDVELATGKVGVRFDPAQTPIDALQAAIEAAGFDVV